MSEKRKSKLGCVLGCLGVSLVGAGAVVLLFGGAGAVGVAWLTLRPSDEPTETLAHVIPTVEEASDSDTPTAADEAPPDETEEEAEAEAETEEQVEEEAVEEEAVAEAPPASTRSSSSRTSTSSSSASSSSVRPSSSGSTPSTPPSTPPSTTTSTTTTTNATNAASSSGSSGDYDFPEPEPERPSTKVDYPPLHEDNRPSRSKSWNVRAEGAITDIRLAVEDGTGTYPVPSLVPEDKYAIEANFGDGRFVEAGKINVKEGSRYFIQCKPSRQKCSVR